MKFTHKLENAKNGDARFCSDSSDMLVYHSNNNGFTKAATARAEAQPSEAKNKVVNQFFSLVKAHREILHHHLML